jgi:hypothetical protein
VPDASCENVNWRFTETPYKSNPLTAASGADAELGELADGPLVLKWA